MSEWKKQLIEAFGRVNFCPDSCEFLSITEKMQDKTPGKPDHVCMRYNTRVIHGSFHPLLMRCDECIKYKIVEWKRVK